MYVVTPMKDFKKLKASVRETSGFVCLAITFIWVLDSGNITCDRKQSQYRQAIMVGRQDTVNSVAETEKFIIWFH